MTASYQLELVLDGTISEIREMLQIVGLYDGERQQYFTDIEVNENNIDLKNLTEEDTLKIISSGKVKVTALGPYGHYGELIEVDLFREMAEKTPKAWFEAEISGSGAYEEQNLKCELKKGILNFTTFSISNEEADKLTKEAWIENFIQKIPRKKFQQLFKITGENFDDDSYFNVLSEIRSFGFENFAYMEYSDFVFQIEANDAKTELKEKEYLEIMSDILPQFGVLTPEEFEFDYECEGGETNKYVYDPVAKTYVGKSKPFYLIDQIENVDDLLAAGLNIQGLPSDGDVLANLSIEDAYAALAAALDEDFGKNDNLEGDDK